MFNHNSLLCGGKSPPRMLLCSAAACGVRPGTTWTRWWSTACCLSSTPETGSCSPTRGPTVRAIHCARPPTPPHPLSITSSPPQTGRGLWSYFAKERSKQTEIQSWTLTRDSFPSTRFEMQDIGVAHEATLKNFSLVPYFLAYCQTAAGRSVPA